MTEKVDYATLKRGGFMRQKQKNRFSLRLHVVGGALSAENLRSISAMADKYGNGTVHLTARPYGHGMPGQHGMPVGQHRCAGYRAEAGQALLRRGDAA